MYERIMAVNFSNTAERHQPTVSRILPNPKQKIQRKVSIRTSLVVQWLKLHTLNAGGLGLILSQRTGFHMLQLRDSTCRNEVEDSRVLQLRPGTAK